MRRINPKHPRNKTPSRRSLPQSVSSSNQQSSIDILKKGAEAKAVQDAAAAKAAADAKAAQDAAAAAAAAQAVQDAAAAAASAAAAAQAKAVRDAAAAAAAEAQAAQDAAAAAKAARDAAAVKAVRDAAAAADAAKAAQAKEQSMEDMKKQNTAQQDLITDQQKEIRHLKQVVEVADNNINMLQNKLAKLKELLS